MLTFKDILFAFLLWSTYLALTYIIFSNPEYQLLILPLFLIFTIMHIAIKRNKRIMKYVIDDFKKINYDLIEENPIPIFDTDFTVKQQTIFVNDISISRYGYIRKFHRLFKAKKTDGSIVELNAIVTKNWNGRNSIEIKKVTSIE